MPTNRLSRSIPFWVLVGGSVVAIAGGLYLVIDKLATMATTLTDGSATGVEVYAGQIWAVAGAILVGVGLVGLALALTLGALGRLLAPSATVEVVEPPAWEEVDEIDAVPAAQDLAAAPAAADAAAGADEPVVDTVAGQAPRA